MKQRTKGFTVIELLMVMAILLILFGMLMLGLKSAQRQAQVSATRTRLQNCQSMLQNLDADASLTNVQAIYSNGPNFTAGYASTAGIPAPGDVTTNTNSVRLTAPAILATQQVMVQLLRVPDNKNTLNKLPPNDMLQLPGAPSPAPPVLLDAWGNPMIFVPAGGLSGVKLGGSALTNPVTAPDGKGFWVSGGPDGNISTGDDNVYSFTSGK